MEKSTIKKQTIAQLMSVNVQDQRTLLNIADATTCEQTKRKIYDMVGTLQSRWDDLYQLSWK